MELLIKKRLEKAIQDGVFPGGVVGYEVDAKQHVISCGTTDGKIPVTNDTLYDVASITKAIPTATLALQLIDQKKISLEDSVKKYLPDFRHSEVTLWHLLTHTVSFGNNGKPLRLSVLKDESPESIRKYMYAAELLTQLGITYSYSNMASILLGMVIEVVVNARLEDIARNVFFQPLGMYSTSFRPNMNKNIAPTEIEQWRGIVKGVVHDESAYALQPYGAVGSAGLFSTVPDLLLFLQMLLNDGVSNGKMYLTKAIIQEMFTNQLLSQNASTGLGWELHQPQYMGKYANDQMIGKTGFTGCVVIVDRRKSRSLVILSNYTYPSRKTNAILINQLRRDISDIVFQQV